MSIRLMTKVWELSRSKGASLLVLLALADSCNDEGYCWPSMATIAKKARVDRRQVIRIIKQLEEMGEINVKRRVKNGVKTSNMYWVTIKGGSDMVSPPVGGSDMDTTRGSGTGVTRVVVQESLKPSINRNIEPPLKGDEVKIFSNQDVIPLLTRVSGLVAFPSREAGREEQILRFLEAYGTEKTEQALRAALESWKISKRKDGSGTYRITTMGWVDWAQDLLLNNTIEKPFEEMTAQEMMEWAKKQV